MRPLRPWMLLAAWVLGALTFAPLPDVGGFTLPSWSWLPSIASKADKATYVYEKDMTAIPNEVQSALNKLNRDRKILASVYEHDTKNGNQTVPEQYKVAVTAADASGLPSLVATAGARVLKVTKDPKTEADVLGGVP